MAGVGWIGWRMRRRGTEWVGGGGGEGWGVGKSRWTEGGVTSRMRCVGSSNVWNSGM